MTFNDSTQSAATAQASSLQSELESAISDLKTAASGYLIPALSQAGFDNNPTWAVDRGREVTLSGLGDLPTDRPTMNLPAFNFNPEDLISADVLTRNSYDSDFFNNFLDSRLRDFIDTESAFIAQDVQDALFNQTRDRDIQILHDAIDAVDRQHAAQRAFPVPMSVLSAARAEVIARYQNTRSDRNREITALIAERAHDGRKHSIDAGIRMEDIRARFQLEFGRLYWQAADWLIREFEARVRAEIAEFTGELDLIKADTATKQGMANFDQAYEQMEQNQELARLNAHIAEMSGLITTWAESFKGRIQAAAKASDYYSSAVAGWLNQITAINFEDTSG